MKAHAPLLLALLLAASASAQPSGTVVAWGDDSQGQATPPAGLTDVVAVSAGFVHGLALKRDGTVVGWGNNTFGQATPPPGLSRVTAVAAGAYHNLALKSDSTVVAWGNNFYGEGTVPDGLSGVVAVAAGLYHNLALKADGTVVAWGSNVYDMRTVPSGLSGVVAVAANVFQSLALKADGTVVAWGANDYGVRAVPPGLSGVTAIAAGSRHNLALKSDGTVVAWGDNAHGQTAVPPGLSGVVAVDAEQFYSLALKSDGTVVVWGDNSQGQATPPAGLSNAIGVAAGGYFGLALVYVPPVPCTTAAPLYVESFVRGAAGSVTVRNSSATAGVVTGTCHLAAFDVFDEVVTEARRLPAGTRAPGAAVTLPLALPEPGEPGAFAVLSRGVVPETGVLDVLRDVVAAVVYDGDGAVVGACGGGPDLAACPSPEGQAAVMNALAALYGGTDAEGDADDALAVTVAPNPSASGARVSFGLAEASAVRVAVYDALGREVAVLADRALPAGPHTVTLDAGSLPSGLYLVRLAADGRVRTARLVVAR